MSLLLDTHTVIWWIGNSRQLTDKVRAAITNEEDVLVSIATAWEIAVKQSVGKLKAPDDLQEQLEQHNFRLLPITLAHASRVRELPLIHRDPFDRMLVAQAQIEGLTIVTRDANIMRYGVPVLEA